MKSILEASTAFMFLGAALFACAESNSVDGPGEPIPAKPETREERIEFRRQLQPQKDVQRQVQDRQAPVVGEVPAELLEKVYGDLQVRTGGDRSGFEILRGQSVLWNDGALGCAEPGQIYTQALVNGYWIVIEYGGKQFDYRATVRGFFRLCPGPSLTQGPPSQ